MELHAGSQGPGKKDVTLTSVDVSWMGAGKTSFRFVDSRQQALANIVDDKVLQDMFFDLARKGMGSKPGGLQTSDPSGVTGTGRFFKFNLIIVPSVFQ